MKRLVFAVALLLLLAPVRAAEDFTGKGSGAFVITEPEQKDDVVFLDLKQKGAELTGTAGPRAEQQWPLKGTVDGSKLTFEVQHEGGLAIKFALTFADGHLKGDAGAEMDGMKLAAKIDVQRVKSGG
jgi:hypothetical protein